MEKQMRRRNTEGRSKVCGDNDSIKIYRKELRMTIRKWKVYGTNLSREGKGRWFNKDKRERV